MHWHVCCVPLFYNHRYYLFIYIILYFAYSRSHSHTSIPEYIHTFYTLYTMNIVHQSILFDNFKRKVKFCEYTYHFLPFLNHFP